MTDLRQKVEDVINILNVATSEAEDVERARMALEATQIVASDREKKLNEREANLIQKETELTAQQKYIDEKHADTQIVLRRVIKEKEELKNLTTQRQQIEADRLQLEADGRAFEKIKSDNEHFEQERTAFEEEKRFFLQEKVAFDDAQKLAAIREENIKKKEDRIDTIERMTQV